MMEIEMVKTIAAVECAVEGCDALHSSKDVTFFTVYGNICIGTEGGIVGNNFGDNNRVENAPT